MQEVATDGVTIEEVPTAAGTMRVPQIIVYNHSPLFYWWPAWVFGFLIALLQQGLDRFHSVSESQRAGSELGLSYVCVLLLLIIFTNVRLRGIYSVALLLAIAFVAVSL